MDKLIEFFDVHQKRLSRPVKDLDDIRAHMAALSEIRDAEVQVDQTIAPIEDAYAMLVRYGLTFNDGNAERVDSLGYAWRLLRQQVNTAKTSNFSLVAFVASLSCSSRLYKRFILLSTCWKADLKICTVCICIELLLASQQSENIRTMKNRCVEFSCKQVTYSYKK